MTGTGGRTPNAASVLSGVARWLHRVRVVGWAVRACWRAHREIRIGPLARVVVPAPPARPAGRGRGAVLWTVRLLRASCLERALVLQRWDAAGHRPRDVVVGVCLAGDRMRAHAWVDGEDPGGDFVEIYRRPPTMGAVR